MEGASVIWVMLKMLLQVEEKMSLVKGSGDVCIGGMSVFGATPRSYMDSKVFIDSSVVTNKGIGKGGSGASLRTRQFRTKWLLM